MQPPPRSVPRTIENTREVDETVCKPDDEEVLFLILFIFPLIFLFVYKKFWFLILS
jgi:hypothetical protein